MHENYLHITGESVFTYDMNLSEHCLYGKVLYSTIAKGKIRRLDISGAKALEGVKCVMTYKDIPGVNDASGFEGDEPCLAENEIMFYGQGIAIVAAISLEIAEKAIKLIEVEYEEEIPILTIDEAIKANSYLYPHPAILQKGDPEKELHKSDYYIDGIVESPAQEQWYLETQCTFAVPTEDDGMEIYSSTQSPTEIQDVVSKVLGVTANCITVKVKRIGGGFGGKETNATKAASWAAILAHKTGERVYFRLNREEDQIMTGKRHPFKTWYQASFDKTGKLHAIVYDAYSNGGYSRDLSLAIMERALFHAENTYYCPNIRFTGHCCKTNLVSFTAFRGFGGPQGTFVMEHIMERISKITGIDAWDVRTRNFFTSSKEDDSHYSYYSQPSYGIENLLGLQKDLRVSSEYDKRKENIKEFNASHRVIKRGIGITPIKFGIGFTNSFLNQGTALINIYRKDGSVQVSHGGIDMGQGINEKIRIIVAKTLGITPDKIRMMRTNTDKAPNSSPTAASTGTDLNGMAAYLAAKELNGRLASVAAKRLNCDVDNIIIEDNNVWSNKDKDTVIQFDEIVNDAYISRISLSAIGYYDTPGIRYIKDTLIKHPFTYYVYGMAVSEVEYNTLTKEIQIIRTDILHDVGKSIDEEIDKGQIAGAFMQGMGWLTMENIKWNEKGRPLNVSPDTYKIPTIQDIPTDFRISLWQKTDEYNAVFHSKALGEPPLLYGHSVYMALQNAMEDKNGF